MELVFYTSVVGITSNIELMCFVCSRVRQLKLHALYIFDEEQSENVVAFRCVFFKCVIYEICCRCSETADMLVAITEAMLDNVVILVVKDDVFVFCCESSNMEAASRNT